MAESYSVKAILSAQDKNFSSIMKSCQGYANNLKTTLTGGLGFGAMAAIGGKAMSLVTNSVSDLSKETIETSDSMYKLQAAMRFSGYSEAEIQRIAGATGTLKTYADKTVFSLQDVMSTFGSLSANGIKDADKLTEAVGNAVAVFGGGAKEYSSVALAFSQAMAAGALHAQDWNQIINASPQLAGGLRKELIKLNPTLGNDFKGAMEKGAITADMLGQAINNIGMTDMAKEAATSVTTFEGAMGNLEASAVSGMMKLYDTFAKPKVIDAINGMTGKVEAGFDKLSTGIPKAIEIISPYWDVFKDDAVKVGKAFGEAAESIVGEVENLTGAFGKKESVENFSDSLGTATDALTTFADFLKEHDKEVAKAITLLPKLYVAFKGFKIVSAVAPGVKTFAGAIVSMTGKGIATLAGKLFGVAAGEKAVGTASKESSGTIVESAKAFVAIGAGVALIAAGFSLLAYSAVQIAQAGPLAAGVLIGMTGAVAGLMVVAKNVAPAMTAGATGFIAFGAAVLIAAAGIAILSLAAVNLANAGPLAIGCMVGMVAAIAGLALGAAALLTGIDSRSSRPRCLWCSYITGFNRSTAGKCWACHSSRCTSDHCAIWNSGSGLHCNPRSRHDRVWYRGCSSRGRMYCSWCRTCSSRCRACSGWYSCPDCGGGRVASGSGSTDPWCWSYSSRGRAYTDGSCIPCCIIWSFSNSRSPDSLNSIILRSCSWNGRISCCGGCIWSSYGWWRSWHACDGGSIKVC